MLGIFFTKPLQGNLFRKGYKHADTLAEAQAAAVKERVGGRRTGNNEAGTLSNHIVTSTREEQGKEETMDKAPQPHVGMHVRWAEIVAGKQNSVKFSLRVF